MLQGGVAAYDSTDFKYMPTKIKVGSAYKDAIPWVYTNGEWKVAGGAGCLMIEWYDKDGNLMTDSTGKTILVRQVAR